MELKQLFGNIDVYLFDQILKGRFEKGDKIIDVGCGKGRNLVFFLQQGYNVYGIDKNEESINELKQMSKRLAPKLPTDHFLVGNIEQLPFEEKSFDWVLCNAVLHFANDKAHFEQMLFNSWAILKPGGYFFARLASKIGMEDKLIELDNGRYLLPDESERYLVDELMLKDYTKSLNAELVEYIKTSNVQGLRCMTTWVMRKGEQ